MTRAKMTTGHRDFEVVRELTAAVAEGNLGRVVNALEFGREHLGSAEDGASALSKLLRSDAANALPRTTLRRAGRHAEILHAFLLHGADANAQDRNGDTPLHCAVFGGHERCVWVLLDVGRPNLDVENSDEQTPLVKGYLMLWQRPPEQAVRALSTLAQVAGVARVTAARSVVDEQVRKKLSNNRSLVDFAADGNCEKMLAELRKYADPNSRDKEGQSALEATITNGQHDAFNLLRDFKVSLKNLDGKPSLLELASTAGQPAMVLALLETASEKMELELLFNSPDALRIVGKLEPKLIVPYATDITTKLSSDSLGMRIAAVCVLDCLGPSVLPSGAAALMDKIRAASPMWAAVGMGWRLVRRVKAGGTWHPSKDHLAGTDVYGVMPSGKPETANATFSRSFSGESFTHFLFATGDEQVWLYCTKEAVLDGHYNNSQREILKSSDSLIPYTAAWYMRSGAVEDPWISVTDHASAIPNGKIVYGASSAGSDHATTILPHHNGANVWIY